MGIISREKENYEVKGNYTEMWKRGKWRKMRKSDQDRVICYNGEML